MIVRVAKRRRYTVIDNQPIEDERLSFKALGVLTYLLSHPDESPTVAELAAAHRSGQYAMQRALAELEKCGYLDRSRGRDGLGRFTRSVVPEVES